MSDASAFVLVWGAGGQLTIPTHVIMPSLLTCCHCLFRAKWLFVWLGIGLPHAVDISPVSYCSRHVLVTQFWFCYGLITHMPHATVFMVCDAVCHTAVTCWQCCSPTITHMPSVDDIWLVCNCFGHVARTLYRTPTVFRPTTHKNMSEVYP